MSFFVMLGLAGKIKNVKIKNKNDSLKLKLLF